MWTVYIVVPIAVTIPLISGLPGLSVSHFPWYLDANVCGTLRGGCLVTRPNCLTLPLDIFPFTKIVST